MSIFKRRMKVAIYCRVSSKSQNVENQIFSLVNYAVIEEREGGYGFNSRRFI